jgi:hypothetical protein
LEPLHLLPLGGLLVLVYLSATLSLLVVVAVVDLTMALVAALVDFLREQHR